MRSAMFATRENNAVGYAVERRSLLRRRLMPAIRHASRAASPTPVNGTGLRDGNRRGRQFKVGVSKGPCRAAIERIVDIIDETKEVLVRQTGTGQRPSAQSSVGLA